MSPALSAFLRGIERRAYVFAQVQCGRHDQAEAALSRTMRAFTGVSDLTPLAAWPATFWSLLTAQPELSGGDSDVPELKSLSSGPRAALLLRIVAGLDFAHAATVLGVGEQTYRFALQRALQQLGEAGVSYAVLGALRERLHRQVKTLPEARTATLADLRTEVLQRQPERIAAPPAPVSPWPRRFAWIGLAALLLGFAATFWTPVPQLDAGSTENLPATTAPTPVVPGSTDSDLVTHPDYAQLAAPADETLASDLALLSWLASGEAVLPDPVPGAAASTDANGSQDADRTGATEPDDEFVEDDDAL